MPAGDSLAIEGVLSLGLVTAQVPLTREGVTLPGSTSSAWCPSGGFLELRVVRNKETKCKGKNVESSHRKHISHREQGTDPRWLLVTTVAQEGTTRLTSVEGKPVHQFAACQTVSQE